MSEISTVIWDGDNTLWDWMGYAVPAYEAMCEEIARIADTDFETTAAAMKAFYAEKGTLEDPRVIQGLNGAGFFNNVENFDQDATISRVQGVFSRVRRANLHLYDGIEEPLQLIHGRGLKQILLTDAPEPQARARIRHANLSLFFDSIHAMPGPDIRDLPTHFQRSLTERANEPITHIAPNEKPHSDLESILDMTREQIARQVVMIGDNDAKDMGLARLYGCRGIHAAYGAANPADVARIQRFAPQRVAGRNMQLSKPQSSAEATDAVPGSQADKNLIRVARHPSEIIGLLC